MVQKGKWERRRGGNEAKRRKKKERLKKSARDRRIHLFVLLFSRFCLKILLKILLKVGNATAIRGKKGLMAPKYHRLSFPHTSHAVFSGIHELGCWGVICRLGLGNAIKKHMVRVVNPVSV
jgi:hypothetical protein